jgi:hypothetical protein
VLKATNGTEGTAGSSDALPAPGPCGVDGRDLSQRAEAVGDCGAEIEVVRCILFSSVRVRSSDLADDGSRVFPRR